MKPPSDCEVEKYVDKVLDEIFTKKIDKDKIIANIAKDMHISARWKPACRIVAKKIVRNSLALRRKLVGELLKVVRSVGQHTFSEEMFEEGSHTVSSEPYFWET